MTFRAELLTAQTMVRALQATLLLAIAALICAAPALADSSSEYGEAIRFGGFDSSAYNSGHYGGKPTSGEFLDPTGFTVDPQDNTVYVADRTSTWESNPTTWRIQQFSPMGAVLGTTTFTLPNGNFGASALAGLAVDHRAGRLYALLIGSPPVSSPNHTTPVAQELLAWSTTPVSGGLVAAKASDGGDLPEDPLAHEAAHPREEDPGSDQEGVATPAGQGVLLGGRACGLLSGRRRHGP